jgi:hypothetical protein
MASQYVWMGIAVGVFLGGIGVGYSIFASTTAPQSQLFGPQMMQQFQQNPQMMNQWNQQMMDSEFGRQQMMMSAMQNEQFMHEMMDDSQFQSEMRQYMNENHDFLQGTLMDMMDDPAIRAQMVGHMLEHDEARQQLCDAIGEGSEFCMNSQMDNGMMMP